MIDSNADYVPTNDTSRFYLNTRAPSTTSGAVSRIRYCYVFQSGIAVRLYQATVGFYQFSKDGVYTLISSFNITKNATGIEANDDMFLCEDMEIPKMEVREGEMIGVCSRDFDKSIGRIILVSQGEEVSDFLFRNGFDDRDNFCYMEGTVPLTFSMDEIGYVSNHHLLLTANITDQGEQNKSGPSYIPSCLYSSRSSL